MKTNIPPLNIIVAVDEEGGFGKNGKIPWYFKEDFEHFKDITKNSICLMGRKTYEDMLKMYYERKEKTGDNLPIKPPTEILPGRTSFVISSNSNYKAEGAKVAKSIREAVQSLDSNDNRNIFVLGGYRLFIESLPWVNTIYLTLVKGKYNCDVFFPINSLNKKFMITDGIEKENLYFLTYKRVVFVK